MICACGRKFLDDGHPAQSLQFHRSFVQIPLLWRRVIPSALSAGRLHAGARLSCGARL
jgi:hypothetical protein